MEDVTELGNRDGSFEGKVLGKEVGTPVGPLLGKALGMLDGFIEGNKDSDPLGILEIVALGISDIFPEE